MARIEVKSVIVAKDFEVCYFTGDDGYPAAKAFSPVAVTTVDGREFFLPIGIQKVCKEEGEVYYTTRYDALRIAEKVYRVGSIDPVHWMQVDTRSLEDRLADYAYEEMEERFYSTGSVFS